MSRKKKKLYNALLIYLENLEDSSTDFQHLTDIINIQHEIENREDFEHFLHLITNIGDNYHRTDLLFPKLFQIIKYYQDQFKQTFSNYFIFNIFQSNKIILLFLFKNKIITVDQDIYIELMSKNEGNGYRYCHFFYPEIKDFINEEKIKEIKDELISNDPNIFVDFEEKRQIGEWQLSRSPLLRLDG